MKTTDPNTSKGIIYLNDVSTQDKWLYSSDLDPFESLVEEWNSFTKELNINGVCLINSKDLLV